MPRIDYHLPVNADLQTIWRVLLDKIEHPERYQAGVQKCNFLESTDDYAVREVLVPGGSLKERITIDERQGEVQYELLEDPWFTGVVKNSLIPPDPTDRKAVPIVQFQMDWQPRNNEASQLEIEHQHMLKESIREGVQFVKDLAEHMEKQQQEV